MSCTPHAGAAIGVAPTFVSRAASLVRRAWRAYWERRARKSTVFILRSLDARTLHDIGISPSEIESLVQCNDERRRRYDAAWLWRRGGG
jgi:uncharacterized protein YjiS (DUF1127 family)